MTTNNTKQKYSQIVTPIFRVSFASVFEARKADEKDPNSKAKFSLVMLFKDKSKPQFANCTDLDAADLTPLKNLVRDAVIEKFGPDTSKWPKHPTTGASLLRMPFRDGAEKDYEGYGPGITFCSASSVMKPGVVDHMCQPILVPSDFYSGCYGAAEINFFAYNSNGSKGISAGLNNVIKLEDGKKLSGGRSADEAFSDLA